MTEPTTYEIVLKGRVGDRLLRPLVDDFESDQTDEGFTRLVGEARDSAHLHGVVAYLTSVNVELISIGPVHSPIPPSHARPQASQPTQNQNERNPRS